MSFEAEDMDQRRLALYRTLAESWNAAGIEYGVVSGLTPDNPESLGRDLDVLVSFEDLERATELTLKIMRNLNWEPVTTFRPWTTLITGIADGVSGAFAVEVDLFSSQRWFNVRLVDGPVESSSIWASGNIRLDPWGSFAKRILLQILGSGSARLSQDPDRFRLFPAEEVTAAKRLAELLGDPLGAETLNAIRRRDLKWIERNAPRIRRTIAARALRNRPARTLADSFAWVRDELITRFVAERAAPIVAIVGPDGVGKSSAIAELKSILETSFRFENVELRHWRPGLLPPLQRFRQERNRADLSGTSPPRREYGRFSSLRLLYYGIDFLLGHPLRDRRQASQLVPVLYDRCLLDMAVDPLRYGLRSGNGVQRLWQLLPGPDLVIFVDDDIDRIRSRKPELPPDELLRQLTLWRRFVSAGLVDVLVSAGNSPEETAGRILPYVLDHFVELGTKR